MPLVNEVVIPLGQKDMFNGPRRRRTINSTFAGSVLNPELAKLIPVLYPGVTVPDTVDLGLGLGGREDIATIFLTGIPGREPAEEREAVGDAAAQHRPRRAASRTGAGSIDDVTDIELRALAGGTAFTPELQPPPEQRARATA